MAQKQSNLPCFEAFGVISCPDFCSYFFLVCGGGGGGHSRVSERRFLSAEVLLHVSHECHPSALLLSLFLCSYPALCVHKSTWPMQAREPGNHDMSHVTSPPSP